MSILSSISSPVDSSSSATPPKISKPRGGKYLDNGALGCSSISQIPYVEWRVASTALIFGYLDPYRKVLCLRVAVRSTILRSAQGSGVSYMITDDVPITIGVCINMLLFRKGLRSQSRVKTACQGRRHLLYSRCSASASVFIGSPD